MVRVLGRGGRTVEVFNLPGHTTESVVLFDGHRNQIFTGDFVYRHLGGIIDFALAMSMKYAPALLAPTREERMLNIKRTDSTSQLGATPTQ